MILHATDAGLQLKDGKVEVVHFLMEENLWDSVISMSMGNLPMYRMMNVWYLFQCGPIELQSFGLSGFLIIPETVKEERMCRYIRNRPLDWMFLTQRAYFISHNHLSRWSKSWETGGLNWETLNAFLIMAQLLRHYRCELDWCGILKSNHKVPIRRQNKWAEVQ